MMPHTNSSTQTSAEFIRVASQVIKVLFALLWATTLMFGQGVESGSIAGTVKDVTGAVIGGATVKVKSLATGIERTATTGSIGQYQIQSLTPGEYEVVVSNNKLKPTRRQRRSPSVASPQLMSS
jgi:hypothetical protein